jgi:hypothetical protein
MKPILTIILLSLIATGAGAQVKPDTGKYGAFGNISPSFEPISPAWTYSIAIVNGMGKDYLIWHQDSTFEIHGDTLRVIAIMIKAWMTQSADEQIELSDYSVRISDMQAIWKDILSERNEEIANLKKINELIRFEENKYYHLYMKCRPSVSFTGSHYGKIGKRRICRHYACHHKRGRGHPDRVSWPRA